MNLSKDPLLLVENLSVASRLPVSQILHEVNMTLRRGECVGIIGSSGSGKTSLAKSIIGLLHPDQFFVQGAIKIRDKDRLVDLLDMQLEKRYQFLKHKTAYIFQEPASTFDPLWRIDRQLIAFAKGKAERAKARKDMVAYLTQMRILDIERVARSYPHQLSGGQLQRCVIAQALLLDAEIIIADEPTASLDRVTEVELMNIFQWIKESLNKTILFISHDYQLLKQLVDRVFEVNEGQLIEKSLEALDSLPRETHRTQLKDSEVPILSLQKCSIRYGLSRWKRKGQVHALSDFSVDIYRGDVVGLIGESGSGKSSLAKALVGLVQFDSGSILWEEKPLFDYDRRARSKKIQIIFQNPYASLHPDRTIADQLLDVLQEHFQGNREARLDELMHSVGLSLQSKSKYPHQFSGGQRQRIAILRALAVTPSLLICDECVSSLDRATQEEILDLLRHINQQFQVTILFITHDIRIVRHFCHYLVVLKEGNMVEKGPVKVIINDPKQDYTQKLVGELKD